MNTDMSTTTPWQLLKQGLRARLENFARKGAIASNSTLRNASALGPWNGLQQWYVPRQVNPHLYEAMREAIAPIDGAINRMVTMDGIIRVEGDDGALVDEIDDWVRNVPVNDLQRGLQTFKDALGNEMYEQGCAIGEYITDAKARDIVGLRVADSKGILFRRTADDFECWYQRPAPATVRGDGTDRVEQMLRSSHASMTAAQVGQSGYVRVPLDRIIYQSFANEADNPYGVSLLRSMEFCAQILLVIQNATEQVWRRFGDPPLSLTYKTKNRKLTQSDLAARQVKLSNDLANAMNAKRQGNTADFVQAIGADDELVISVIGAQDKIIEIETPARHVLEQIVAKSGLPSWMLGFHWSTAERLAESQGNIVIQESRTRWARSEPAYTGMVANMLRMRGRTWKRGAWKLTQELPNLSDVLKMAQAEFLKAQTVLMLRGGQPTSPVDGSEAGKAMQTHIDRIAAKLVGIDDEALRRMAADPTLIEQMVSEAQDP